MTDFRNHAIRAFCIVHLIAIGAPAYPSKAEDGWLPMIGLALLMCQCALLASWGALGKSRGRFRKTVALLYVAGLIFITAKTGLRKVGDGLIGMFCPAFGGAGLLTFLALAWIPVQRRGFELIDLRETPLPGAQNNFQFSIRQAFYWTTVIALLFAVGQWMPRVNESAGGTARALSDFLGLAICVGGVIQFVALMLLAGWANLSAGDCRGRLAILLFTTLIFGALFPSYVHAEPQMYGYSVGLWLGYASLLSASLLFFRACGYRLVRVALRR